MEIGIIKIVLSFVLHSRGQKMYSTAILNQRGRLGEAKSERRGFVNLIFMQYDNDNGPADTWS